MAFALSFDARVPVAAWEAFFAERPHYTVVEDADGAGLHALYENPDTEVDFAFAWSADVVTFELAQDRVLPFVYEADFEVLAFVARFGIAWPPGTLLRAWEAGRPRRTKKSRDALAAGGVERLWRWNRERHALAAQLELLVPKIWLARVRGSLKTGVDWAPDVASALPEVDLLWASWVGSPGQRLVPGATVARWGAPIVAPPAALPYRRIGEEGVLPQRLSLLAGLPQAKPLKRLAFASLHEF